MKTIVLIALIISLIFCIVCIPKVSNAQAPKFFNYQGAARDLSGAPLASQTIGLQISLIPESIGSSATYKETHATETNELGLFNIHIGDGEVLHGNFESTDWGAGPYYIQVEMDAQRGGNYQLAGTVPLLSVPYALHAANGSKWKDSENGLYYPNNVLIGKDKDPARSLVEEALPQLSLTAPALGQVPGSINNERFIDCQIEDASSDFFRIQNGTNSNGQFIPFIQGHHDSHTWHALQLVASTSPTKDQSQYAPLMIFDSRLRTGPSVAENNPVQNRDLFSWTSFGQTKMLLSANGDLGVGTSTPKSKLQVTGGDVYIDDVGSGIIMKDANGGCWRVSVETDGSFKSDSLLTCP